MNRVLIVTSVASMIDQFIMPSIELLIDMGYEVDVATNFIKGSTCSDVKINQLLERLDRMKVDCYQIDFDRKILDLRADINSFKQLDAVVCGRKYPINPSRYHCINLHGEKYSFIHSHSPIGGVVGRIEGKKHKITNVYTAHGFHFYKGAPFRNWMFFYPIERAISRITDVLITINREDYCLAKDRLKAKNTIYIPGIGVDVRYFADLQIDRDYKRSGLGLKTDDVMLLSVGELNTNKNHRVVIEALGSMDDDKRTTFHYFIAGKDAGQKDSLIDLAKEKRVNLHILGFRTDIPELLKATDVFVLSSFREGLNVSLMEAMASGTYCLATNIRGNRDLLSDDALFDPYTSKDLANKLLRYNRLSDVDYEKSLKQIDKEEVDEKLKDLYMHLL